MGKFEDVESVMAEEFLQKRINQIKTNTILPINQYKFRIDIRESFDVEIPSIIIEDINRLCGNSDIGRFLLIFTALSTVLSDYSSKDTFYIGTTSFKELNVKCEYPLFVKIKLNNNCSWRQLLESVRNDLAKVVKYQNDYIDEYFIKLQNDEKCKINYAWQVAFVDTELQDITENLNKFYLCIKVIKKNNEYIIKFDYNAKVYSDILIKFMSEKLIVCLSKMKYFIDNDADINEKETVLPSEKDFLVNISNSSKGHFDSFSTLHQQFEKQVKELPTKIAVVEGENKITYDGLNRRANKLARELLKYGVKTDDVIAIIAEPNIETIIAIIAVLKSGAAYCPIDYDLSQSRINQLLNKCYSSIVLSTKTYNENKILTSKILDITKLNLNENSGENLLLKVEVNNLAYVIYTSGSTGEPKGVMVEHKNIVNQLLGLKSCYTFDETLNHILMAPFTFDPSVQQIFLPLVTGGLLVLIAKEDKTQPDKFWRLIEREKINIINMVPSLMEVLLDNVKQPLNWIKYVIMAGEVFTQALGKRLRETFNKACIINIYGPTEATINTTLYQYNESEYSDCVPIGRPLPNYKTYILNKKMELMPFGVKGELYIAGEGIARGYIGDIHKTQEKFVSNIFDNNSKLYKTGDLVRWNSNCELEFIGRIDQQVKIRGIRVELGEIEAIFLKNELIKEIVVIKNKMPSGIDELVAFYTINSNVGKNITFRNSELKSFLKKELPDYMVPSQLVKVENMPITKNGKVDKEALLTERSKLCKNQNIIESKNNTERQLMKIWTKILCVEKIDLGESFFDAGGNSLLIIKLQNSINQEFGVKLSVAQLFTYHTIKEQANFISAKAEDKGEKYEEESSVSEVSNGIRRGKDIAIIGMACKFPQANNIYEFWDNLGEGIDCIGKVPQNRRFSFANGKNTEDSTNEFPLAAYLDSISKFDADFFKIAPNEAKMIDPQQRLFIKVVWEAILNAGYSEKYFYGSKTGVYVGASKSNYMNLLEDIEPSAIPGNLHSLIGGRISYMLNLSGPSVVIDTACSSSLVALHSAVNGIITGDCESAIVGGVNVYTQGIDKTVYSMGIASKDGRTKAFDELANGTGGGEGVGVVILKPLELAEKDGDHIYAVIKGSAINSDGRSNGITAPNAFAQAKVIEAAWKRADIDPSTIGYIETHGTGTKLGDPIEIEGISNAFSKYTNRSQFCAIGSVKTNIGHLDSAAGIAGLIKVVLSLYYKKIPGSLHFKAPNPQINFINSPVYVNSKMMDWETEESLRRAGVSSFGLSGTNCHVALEEYKSKENQCNSMKYKKYLFTLSARTQNALKKYIESYANFLKDTEFSLASICFVTNINCSYYRYRIAVLVTTVSELIKKLKIAYSNFNINSNSALLEKNSVFLSDNVSSNNVLINEQESVENLIKYYLEGAKLDWDEYYKNSKVYRSPIPAYPFEEKEYWPKLNAYKNIEISSEKKSQSSKRTVVNIPNQDAVNQDLLYEVNWVPKQLKPEEQKFLKGNYLVFKDEIGIGSNLIECLRASDCEVITIELGNSYEKNNKYQYKISPNNGFHYLRLMEDLLRDSIQFDHVIHLWSCTNEYFKNKYDELDDRLNVGIYSLYHLSKALVEKKIKQCVDIRVITNNAQRVSQEPINNPDFAAINGLVKVISQENPKYMCYGIDVCIMTKTIHQIAIEIINEILENKSDWVVAIRDRRYVQEISRMNLGCYSSDKMLIRENGVYLVTGGAGKLGLELCDYLTKNDHIKLIIVGRSELPHFSLWEKCGNHKEWNKIQRLNNMNQNGSEVYYYSADVSDYNAMYNLIEEVYTNFGNVNGVIHCAAADGSVSKSISHQDFNGFIQVMKPKIYGTVILDNLFNNKELDFFVMYSSIASLWGGATGGEYAAANAFIDAYGEYRTMKGKKTLVVNWYAWEKFTGPNCMAYMKSSEALRAFEFCLNSSFNQAIIGKFDVNILSQWLPAMKIQLSSNMLLKRNLGGNSMSIEDMIIKKSAGSELKIEGNPNGKYTEVEIRIAQIWAEVLGYDQINVQDNFFDIGGDSLLILKVLTLINERVDSSIEMGDLFSYSTVKQLAQFIELKKQSLSVNYISEQEKRSEIYDSDEDLIRLIRSVKKDAISMDYTTII